MSTPKRPRLLLHIGSHKTGTSAIQEAFHAARELLLTRGVNYPDTTREPWPTLPKHCSTFNAAISDDVAVQDAERAWLLAEATRPGVHTLVISEEGFCEPDVRLTRFFAPLTQHLDLDVVCCLRRQDLFVESMFNQFAREQNRREGRPPLMFARAPGILARLDYHAILKRWTTLPAIVHAADFDSLRNEGGLLPWLSRASGLDLTGLVEPRANPSPDVQLALLLNRLNRQRANYNLAALLKADFEAAAQQGRRQRSHFIGRTERQQLLADHADSNARLAVDFGVHFSDQLPPDEPNFATEAPDQAYLDQLVTLLSVHAA